MITFIARIPVKPECAAAFEALMNHVRDMTLQHEAGVAYYAWSKGVDEPDIYLIIEVYRDASAQAAHMATPWVSDSLAKTAQMLAGKPDVRQYATPGCAPVTERLFGV